MLVLQKCRFICSPKTGSTWVTHALRRACDVSFDIGPEDYHAPVSDPRGAELPSFAFVRHPVTWLRSHWSHAMDNPEFKPQWGDVWSDEWPEFSTNICRQRPGHLSKSCQRWVGNTWNQIEFVGRYEDLADDLVAALRKFKEPFDEAMIRATQPVNVSRTFGSDLDDETIMMIAESEALLINRFYPCPCGVAGTV